MSSYFSKNLKYLRSERGMEQLELAQLLGRKSASSISEWESGNYTPKAGTLSDIARIFNTTLSDLMDRDIELDSGNPRNSSFNPIPLVGTIAAGTPILAEQNIEEYFNLDSRIKADFALRIKGDSMINANIHDGDIAFIKKQQALENRDIGAILIDEEATLKRFYRQDGAIILQSENEKYKPRIFTNGNMKILGKLVAILSIRD